MQAERRCEALVETWRGVELRWTEEEAVRRKCVDEARAEPGRAEAETRRRHEAAAEARRRETEADAEAYGHLSPGVVVRIRPYSLKSQTELEG